MTMKSFYDRFDQYMAGEISYDQLHEENSLPSFQDWKFESPNVDVQCKYVTFFDLKHKQDCTLKKGHPTDHITRSSYNLYMGKGQLPEVRPWVPGDVAEIYLEVINLFGF